MKELKEIQHYTICLIEILIRMPLKSRINFYRMGIGPHVLFFNFVYYFRPTWERSEAVWWTSVLALFFKASDMWYLNNSCRDCTHKTLKSTSKHIHTKNK
jgi:hypothetical protein